MRILSADFFNPYKPIDKQTELDKFYSKIKQFPINKIICLDETSVGSALKPTYSRCNIGICKKTMVMENPRPYRNGRVLVHGLIRCKNGSGYWNRDTNGATNIYKIAFNAINNKARPSYLSRSITTPQGF